MIVVWTSIGTLQIGKCTISNNLRNLKIISKKNLETHQKYGFLLSRALFEVKLSTYLLIMHGCQYCLSYGGIFGLFFFFFIFSHFMCLVWCTRIFSSIVGDGEGRLKFSRCCWTKLYVLKGMYLKQLLYSLLSAERGIFFTVSC